MRRVAIAVIALLVGAAAVPVVGAAERISTEGTCREAGIADPDQPASDCFPGSSIRQAAVAALLYASGVVAALAMLAGAAAALRGSRGLLMVAIGIVAVLLFIGAYGAARI